MPAHVSTAPMALSGSSAVHSTSSCLFIQASIPELPFPARKRARNRCRPAIGSRKMLAATAAANSGIVGASLPLVP
jgi:hypothetical protein